MDLSPHYRFEGSVFFVYDHEVLQKEADLLEDAILYFYPHSMPIDNKCLLCGQLMGLVQFCKSMIGSSPILYRFKKEKFAIKHVGQYSFALAGSNIEPNSILIEQLDRLYSLFAFYHGSVDQVKIDCDHDKELFLSEMHSLWEQYLAFTRNYGDNLPSVFNAVPYLPMKNIQNSGFLKASHILQACQRRPQVIAGCILYNRYILCSQLMDSISRCLLLLKPNQHHHPAIPLETDFQLPYGVRLFSVYLNPNDLNQLLEVKENSPYRTTHNSSTPLMCCCRTKRIIRRKVPMSCHTHSVSNVQDSGRHSMDMSESDPCSRADSENSTTLCKNMLEDLILKGLKCCKCVDNIEGELDEGHEEGSFCRNSSEEGVWKKGNENDVANDVSSVSESLPDQNEVVLDNRSCEASEGTISEFEETRPHSIQSGVTLEGESGIEVTVSDFYSSTATPFEQTSVCSREGQQQVEHRMFPKQITKQYVQQTPGDIECETSKDVEGSQGMQGTLDVNTPHTDPDSGIERKELEDSPGDPKGQQGIWNGDSILEELPHVGPSRTHDDSEGLHKIINDRKLKDEMVDEGRSSTTLSDNDGLQSDDNVRSHEITDHSKEMHGILGDVWGSQGIPEEDIEVDLAPCGGTGLEDTVGGRSLEDVSTSDKNKDSRLIKGCDVRVGIPEEDEKEEKEEDKEQEEEDGKEEEEENKETCANHVTGSKCCEVDGLVHANLFVQAHSEIVLILLTDCSLHQNEDLVKSLWNTSLSELGDLDILLRHSSKTSKEAPQVPYNYLLYDNFEKTMLGNLKEPVFAADHVFCDTSKMLHAHFHNAPQLIDVTLRNLHTNIYGRRTLSKEVYFQENMANSLSSQRHQPQDASSYLEKNVEERLLKDHGLHLV